MEEVECAECGNRYDSSVHTFCPRCGNDRRRGAVSYAPQAFDPRRRRVQAGGVILIAAAGLSLVLYIYAMVIAPSLLTPEVATVMEDQPGGSLLIELDGFGDARINVTTFSGEDVANGTASNGTALFEDLSSAAVNVSVQDEGGTWSRQALVLQGQTTTMRLSVDDPAQDAGLVGADGLVTPIRVLLGFFAAIAAFVVMAGVSALRLRHKSVAVTGAVIGLVPVLILAMAVPNVGTLLLLLLLSVALGFIVMGRQQFS